MTVPARDDHMTRAVRALELADRRLAPTSARRHVRLVVHARTAAALGRGAADRRRALDALLGVNTAAPETLRVARGLRSRGAATTSRRPGLRCCSPPAAAVPGGRACSSTSARARAAACSRRPGCRSRRVIGVELMPEPPRRGEREPRSVPRAPALRRDGARCADAGTGPVADDVTHVFLNNPLIGEARERLLRPPRPVARPPRRGRSGSSTSTPRTTRFAEAFPDARRVTRRRRGLTVYELP